MKRKVWVEFRPWLNHQRALLLQVCTVWYPQVHGDGYPPGEKEKEFLMGMLQ